MRHALDFMYVVFCLVRVSSVAWITIKKMLSHVLHEALVVSARI